MQNIQQFINDNNLSSIDFLRDAIAFYNSRIESRNEGQTLEELLTDYVQLRKEFK